jgi:hypothetical protein
MTSFRRFLVLAFANVLTAISLSAQEPAKIVEQYAKASGGPGKLSKVQTLTLEGSATRADSSGARPGSFTLDVKSPNRYYLELQIGGQSEIIAYNGKSAWHVASFSDPMTLLGPEALQLEAVAILSASHLLNLKKNKFGATSLGGAKIAGHDTTGIELTAPSGVKRQYFFDTGSHLLVRESALTAGVQQDITYDDYRAESGIAVPHKLELRRGDTVYRILIDRVAINQAIGERIFDFPRKSQVQLPDLKKLFAEIEANQKTLENLRENYTGRQSSEETQYDGSGRITRVEREEHTFFYLNGREVMTLVAKDGKPLSPAEQEKENEKTRKHIEEIQKSQARNEHKEEKAREQGEPEKKSDEPGIDSFLRACQFVNPRRERFRGVDVLVFDFEGNPEYKPKNMVEHIAQELAGVVWVDERQHEVVRLEAYFVKNFKIAGGLVANLQQGTSFVFEQAFVNNEVWLPTYEEAHIGARVLLLKGFKVNEVTRYSDYQRFNVDTLSAIGKPKTDSPSVPAGKQP